MLDDIFDCHLIASLLKQYHKCAARNTMLYEHTFECIYISARTTRAYFTAKCLQPMHMCA